MKCLGVYVMSESHVRTNRYEFYPRRVYSSRRDKYYYTKRYLVLPFLIFIILLITTLSLVKPIQYVTRKKWLNSTDFIEQNDTWRIYNSYYCFEAKNALPYEITLLSIGFIFIAVQFFCTFYFNKAIELQDQYLQSWTKAVIKKCLGIQHTKKPSSTLR